MAEKFVEEVYYYSNIISRLRVIVEKHRFQEDDRAIEWLNRMLPELEQAIIACANQKYEEAEQLKEILSSFKHLNDGISLADVLETSVIPIMERWMQSWLSVSEQMDDRYRIESTSSGFLTIKDIKTNRYLHSNNDPMDEARKTVENQFDYSKEGYVVWGCGLGYHVYQLYRISEGTIPITVYEPNLNMVRYALHYGVLAWVPKENLNIVSGYNGEEFLENIQITDGVFLLKPYIDTIQNECQRKMLQQYLLDHSIQGKENYPKNFWENDFAITSYQYAYIISMLRQVVDYCRILDQGHARELLLIAGNGISVFLKAYKEKDYTETVELEKLLTNIYELEDYILIGDLIESAVIPIMEKWVQYLRNPTDTMLDERYKLEYTVTGYLTIKDVRADVYLHSKNDPMNEARKSLERQYTASNKDYAIWGCGLGYHVYQLYLISNGSIHITIYEPNPKMVEYAYEYGVLSWIPKELLKIIYVKNADEFLNQTNEIEEKFFLNSYILTDDKEQRNKLNRVFARFLFGFDAKPYLQLNYYQNNRLGLPYVSQIDHRKLKKEMVVIGGGPSLDHYMNTLKSWQGKKTIIAAGTVWKKLLRAGIYPDFVVIMDPYEIVYQQAENIEDTSATLLLAMQANWRVGKNYKGKKYIIPHLFLIDELDEQVKKTGETLYFSGGSVTVFELEFAMRMYADKVYILGVDLSLPGGMTHAEGTKYCKKVDVSEMIPMEDVNGNTVYTDYVLIESKSWYEMIMSETEGIEYINMSDVGVKLKGTIPYQGKPDKE